MQNNKTIKALRSLPSEQWLCYCCFKTRFKERCKSHTVTPQELCELVLSWRGKNFSIIGKETVEKVKCLMEKGNMREIYRGPHVALHWQRKACNKAARGTQCLASMPCMSHPLMLDPGAGTQAYNTQGRRCCEMKAWMRMDGRGQIHKGVGEGHLGAGRARIKGKRQTEVDCGEKWARLCLSGRLLFSQTAFCL